ncbi:hypothetical protein Cgig2_028849 [Carnegiea gigantea]|uniref:D-aminoacyl-tRNA deacylase n=1 Tax=Carnegiea gigantea TaxID=171969 RepID=A0A9Q1QMC3_9CARY|nr:hypothetical protein Cgig2_028849 [Carnegiea gigantea]
MAATLSPLTTSTAAASALLSPPSSPPFLLVSPLFRVTPSQRHGRVTPTRPSLRVRAMRAVVQRVASASVEVEGRIVSEIGPGLLVLVGIHDSDTDADADYICRKVLNMRLFPNEKTGRAWDHSVMQKNSGVLLVSQFTLYGTLKGNKPDFHVAMPPQRAKLFYESLVEKFRKSYNPDLIKGIKKALRNHKFVIPKPPNLSELQLQSNILESEVEEGLR